MKGGQKKVACPWTHYSIGDGQIMCAGSAASEDRLGVR